MTRFVALLRAVNVGGRGKLAMGDLVAAAEQAGFTDAATILQAGTLVFTADGKTSDLEQRLTAALEARAGLATDVMVRSAAQWGALVAGNPFMDAARDDPAHLVLLVSKSKPATGAEAALRGAIQGRETVAVRAGAAYVVYPDGIGRSRLTNAVLERRLGVPATGRNWNTVLKVAARLGL